MNHSFLWIWIFIGVNKSSIASSFSVGDVAVIERYEQQGEGENEENTPYPYVL
jgi:hypothetical protein